MRLSPLATFIGLAFLAAGSASAQTDKKAKPQRVELWHKRAPLGDGKFQETEVWITVHRPAKPNGTALVICPGGGYGGLVTGAEGHGIAAWLNRHGITGVVLEYRLPAGRTYVPLLDAQRAIRTVRANAKMWGLDPERIGIIGFSAGGHLASTAGTHFDAGELDATDPVQRVSCRPDFMILVYPVISMGAKGHLGSRNNLLGKNPAATLVDLFSNEKQVTPKTPRAFLAHAKDDRVVPSEHSRMFYDALRANKIRAEYLELPSGGHGLNGYKGPMWDAWQTRSLAWLAGAGPGTRELGKPSQILPGHDGAVTCLTFARDGSFLVSGGKDGTARLWDLTTFKQRAALPGHKESIITVALSPDGNTLAVGSHDTEIKLWDTRAGKAQKLLTGHKNEVRSLAFAADGNTLYSGSADYAIKAWNLQTGAAAATMFGHKDEINWITLSADGKTLASSAWDQTVRLWDLDKRQVRQVLTGHTAMVRMVLFQPKGDLLASCDKAGMIRLWDDKGVSIAKLEGNRDLVRAIAFHPDGKLLVSGSKDRTMKLWDVDTRKLRGTLTFNDLPFQTLAFSPDGKTLAAGSTDGKVMIWNTDELLSSK